MGDKQWTKKAESARKPLNTPITGKVLNDLYHDLAADIGDALHNIKNQPWYTERVDMYMQQHGGSVASSMLAAAENALFNVSRLELLNGSGAASIFKVPETFAELEEQLQDSVPIAISQLQKNDIDHDDLQHLQDTYQTLVDTVISRVRTAIAADSVPPRS